jgi:subtilase family serine protease
MALSASVRRTIALLVAALMAAAAVALQASSGGPPGRTARPVPALTGHILGPELSFPPDTTYCRTNLGISCYQPAQFQRAYDLAPLYARGLNGRGSTIVIVDSFGSPTIREDLAHFDQTFGLPDPPSLRIIQPAGEVPPYPQDPLGAADRSLWAGETTLDVEYSHVIAPGANILLVETPTSEVEGVQGFPEIVQAENYVIDHNLGDVISQSFGATEETFPSRDSILDLRSSFQNARRHNVTVLASSGDAGATDLLSDTSCCYPMRVNSWPSSDPLVTSMGGTMLHLDLQGGRLAPDEVWNDAFGAGGGGVSAVFERPPFQNGVRSVVGDQRGTPDISMSSAVDGGAVFYYSFDDWARVNPATGQPPLSGPQWHIVGGTSEASPLFAGIIAITDQLAEHRVGAIDGKLYRLGRNAAGNGIADVTTGDNSLTFCSANCTSAQPVLTTVTGFQAAPGYDLASGWGTVDAARFVPALAGATDDGNDNSQ